MQTGVLRLNNGSGAGTGTITANLAGVVELNSVTVANPFSLSLNGTIRAVAAGDRDAFSRLYADFSRMVHAILRRQSELPWLH